MKITATYIRNCRSDHRNNNELQLDPASVDEYSMIKIEIKIRRNHMHYFWSMFVPLFFIFLASTLGMLPT